MTVDEVKEVLGDVWMSDFRISKLAGVSRQRVSQWRQRGWVPDDLLERLSKAKDQKGRKSE